MSEFLLLYYIALSFAIFLGWAAVSPSPGVGREQVARYLRWAPIAGIVGVAHPALGFAARDVVAQVDFELPEDREFAAKHARVRTVVNACAFASLVVAAVVLVVGLSA